MLKSPKQTQPPTKKEGRFTHTFLGFCSSFLPLPCGVSVRNYFTLSRASCCSCGLCPSFCPSWFDDTNFRFLFTSLPRRVFTSNTVKMSTDAGDAAATKSPETMDLDLNVTPSGGLRHNIDNILIPLFWMRYSLSPPCLLFTFMHYAYR